MAPCPTSLGGSRGSIFDNGGKVVVVKGGFFTQEEFGGLCGHMASIVRVRWVTLNVSFEQALHRAVRSRPEQNSESEHGVSTTFTWAVCEGAPVFGSQ